MNGFKYKGIIAGRIIFSERVALRMLIRQ